MFAIGGRVVFDEDGDVRGLIAVSWISHVTFLDTSASPTSLKIVAVLIAFHIVSRFQFPSSSA